MLTSEQFVGPWAGLPIAWKDDDTFDEKTYRGDVARCCAAGVPGIYTGGTTGEFYALEFSEFKAVTKATIKEGRNGKTPVMIGCSATWTLGVIRRACYAQKKGADAIQIALPFWMDVPDSEILHFFEEVARAVPGMPICIYETLRAKKAISLELHRQIHSAVPTVIGVKSNENTVGAKEKGCAELSKLYHVFTGEDKVYSLGRFGVVGSCSSFVYQNPRILLHMYNLLRQKKWAELKPWEAKIRHICAEGLKPTFEAGCIDSAIDRLLGRSAGFLKTSLRCRAPYPACTETMLQDFRQWLKKNHPEFLEL